MDELRPAKRNVEVEVEVKAVDRFRYDASKSKGYAVLLRLTAFAAMPPSPKATLSFCG